MSESPNPNWAWPPPRGPADDQAWGPPNPTDVSRDRWIPGPPAPRPGVVPLRPLSVGEILDGAISYVRRNPVATLGTAAVLTAVSGVLQAVLMIVLSGSFTGALDEQLSSRATADVADALGTDLMMSVGFLVGAVLSWFVGVLATGMLTAMMGAAVLGRSIGAGEAWRIAGPRIPTLLALTLLVGLAVGGVMFVGLFVAVLIGIAAAPWGILMAIPVGLVGIAAGIWIYVSVLLAPVIVVLERRGARQAWTRSVRLVAGQWWRVFGIQLLAVVIASVIGSIIAVPFQIAATFMTGTSGEGSSIGFWIMITAGATISGLVTLPFSAGVVSLLYVDRRMREEGLDILILAEPMTAGAPGVDMAEELPRVYGRGIAPT